jgi:hypothetical protein
MQLIPIGLTLTISLAYSFAAFHIFNAPTLDVDVMKSPEMLSIHPIDEIPVGCFSNLIVGVYELIGKRLMFPFAKTAISNSSDGFQDMSMMSEVSSYLPYFV